MTDQSQLNLDLPPTQPPATVEGYQFEPIKGYPMLQWKGKRPFTGAQYYPAQLKEVHGPEIEGWRNKIFWGDNLQVMSHLLKEFRGKVDLVYIDPPFDSKIEYRQKVQLRGQILTSDPNTFEEKQYTDIWTNDEYLQFLFERLILTRELLSNKGSLYIHCDWHKSHHIRCLMDEIFGNDKFRNEITWKRSDAHNDTGQGAKFYGRIHDSIFFYTLSDDYTWNQLFTSLPKSTIEKWYRNIEPETGRKYNKADLTARKGGGNTRYEWKGVTPPAGRFWAYSIEKMRKMDEEGKLVYSSSGMPYMKRYLDESKGVSIQDWWDDISMLRGINSVEKVDYPTQKPEALLERIIKASSNPGDIVFDCFMGSGTTQAVAMKLGRRFVGADINLGAVQITTKRLLGIAAELEAQQQQGKLAVEEEASTTYYTGFEVYSVNHYDVFRNPLEAKDLLLEALEVNPLGKGNLFDGEKDGRMVKIMPVNRIATRADLNELIAGFDYKAFEKRQQEHPHSPVERITLVCMGHEPDLAAQLKKELKPFELDVEVVDILRDKQDIQFKRDSEASIVIQGKYLTIEAFYPMNLLGKLSLQQENVEDWRELVESVMIDWNYDGAIFQPLEVDIPGKNDLVVGRYSIPDDAGTIRVKITDLLSESLEMEVDPGT